MAFGDFTTLDAVKAWLKTGENDLPSDNDTMLSGLITSASEWIKQYRGRPIVSQDFQELRDALGGNQFVFAVWPVSAVALVVVNGLSIPPVPFITPSPPGVITAVGADALASGYLFTPTKLVIRGYIVPRITLGLTLQYTAGYQQVPPAINQA